MPLPPAETFCRNACRIRNKIGMTQEELCEKADISVRYVQMLEARTTNPSVDVAFRIKQALGCSWDDLFRPIK